MLTFQPCKSQTAASDLQALTAALKLRTKIWGFWLQLLNALNGRNAQRSKVTSYNLLLQLWFYVPFKKVLELLHFFPRQSSSFVFLIYILGPVICYHTD